MKAKLVKGELIIDIADVLAGLSKEERRDLARSLVADDVLFAAVLECVASDGHFGRFFTEDPDGEWWFDNRKLLELREKLLPLMPEIARGAVKEALRQRNEAQSLEARTSAWAWRMYHAWPAGQTRCRPDGPPEWQPPPNPTDDEIDGLLRVEVKP